MMIDDLKQKKTFVKKIRDMDPSRPSQQKKREERNIEPRH
jgi:hypothetical protein